MSQPTHDVTAADLAQPKTVWTTPAIETYDVAEFTLGANTSLTSDTGLSGS